MNKKAVAWFWIGVFIGAEPFSLPSTIATHAILITSFVLVVREVVRNRP